MRPSDRAIRDVLRREAAQARIPDDMWKQISQRLDTDRTQAERRRNSAQQRAQWKPALAFAAAAGIFWLAVIPTVASQKAGMPSHPAIAPVVKPATQQELSVRSWMKARREEGQRSVATASAAPDRVNPYGLMSIDKPH